MAPLRYLGSRLLHGLLLLVAISILTFALSALAPGEAFDTLRLEPGVSPAAVEAMRARHGLDRPLPERYLSWVAALVRGDLGFSTSHQRPVTPLLLPRARNTLLLAMAATLLAWTLAVPLGVLAAGRTGRWLARPLALLTVLLIAIPDLVLGLGLLLVAIHTGLPVGGMVSIGAEELAPLARLGDLLAHLLLPMLALAAGMLPVLLRHTRSAVAEVLDSPFVAAARARGLSELRLLFRHALPVAANPLISLLGLSIGGLLSGSLLIEVIMSWPGLGPMLLDAILARDTELVLGAILISSVLLLLGNLLADLLLLANDPRIRRPGS